MQTGVKNYQVKYSGSKAYYSCDEIYSLVGAKDAECLANGVWSPHAPPTCESILPKECTEKKQNIWFIVDISSSVKRSQLKKVREFMLSMVDLQTTKKTTVGIITYDTETRIEMEWDHYNSNKDELILEDFLLREHRVTNRRRLDRAFDLLKNSHTPEHASQPKKVILIMADRPTYPREEESHDKALNSYRLLQEHAKENNYEIQVYPIGITNQVSHDDLMHYAYQGDEDNIMQIPSVNALKTTSVRPFVKRQCGN